MIGIVDYGLGNVQAFVNIFRQLGIAAAPVRTAEEMALASRLILPGVGAFDWAMTRLEESGMRSCLDDLVLRKRRPVLGVCVGMQMMASRSDEGIMPGLAWIDAEVRRLSDKGSGHMVRLPHMGWNDASPIDYADLFKGMRDPRFYFLHSYYIAPRNASHVLAHTTYGGNFPSAIRAGNVLGTQFHPEKSHDWGIQLLKNFAEV